MPLTVAQVGTYRPDAASGVSQAIGGLISHLSGAGVSVQLWNFTSAVNGPVSLERRNFTEYQLPRYKTRIPRVVKLKSSAAEFLTDAHQSVDILHLHSVFVPEHNWLSKLGIPYVLSPHAGFHPSVLDGRNRLAKAAWMNLWEADVIRNAATLHAVSDREKADLRNLNLNDRIVTVPNGLERSWHETTTTPPSAGRYWAYMGRLDPSHKGLDLLVRAYAAAARGNASVPELRLAGPDHKNGRRQLEKLVESLGIKKQVHFPGPIYGDEKKRFLSQSILFLHPSRWEGDPFAPKEAMALGRPVIVSPETGLGDIVRAYQAGWVTSGSVESLAACMGRVAALPAEDLDRIGSHGRQLVMDNFSWPTIARQMMGLYWSVIIDGMHIKS